MVGLQTHFLSRSKKSHDGFSRQLAQCEVSTNGAREGAEPRDTQHGSASRHSATQICRKWSIQMSNRVSKSNPLQVLFALVALALIVSLPSPVHAQTFQTAPALAFTTSFASAQPLPHVLPTAHTDH